MGFTMSDEQFAQYYETYRDNIEAIARKIARRDETLFDELCQVGRIGLWRFNPAQVTDNEPNCVRSHLRNRMLDYIRQTRRKNVESLADYLALGDQVVKEGGEVRLVQMRHRRSLVDPDDFGDLGGLFSEIMT